MIWSMGRNLRILYWSCSDIVAICCDMDYSPDRALIGPPSKISWVKKGFLMNAANNKAFFGASIRSIYRGTISLQYRYKIDQQDTTISSRCGPIYYLQCNVLITVCKMYYLQCNVLFTVHCNEVKCIIFFSAYFIDFINLILLLLH